MKLIEELKKANIQVDPTVTADPFRLMKIPNTLHGKTGLIARPIRDISGFNPVHCTASEKIYYKERFGLNLQFYEICQ